MAYKLYILLTILVFSSCVTPKSIYNDGSQLGSARNQPQGLSKGKVDPNCSAVEKSGGTVFIPEGPVVITKFSKTCGSDSVRKDTNWMAMGFPCANHGKIETKGKIRSPKIISFNFNVACSMTSFSKPEINQLINQKLQLQSSSRMLAFNPFALQYWRFGTSNDAGVGTTAKIQTYQNLALWKRFIQGEAIDVRLYGRENAWINQNTFYEVQARIIYLEHKKFKLDVVSVNKLTPEKTREIFESCSKLKPKRPCHLAFPSS